MNRSVGISLLTVFLIAAGVSLIGTQAARAQGCAMCKLSAEAGGERTARALDYGIFILMTPTVVIFLGIFYWAFTHRDRTLAEQMEERSEEGALLAGQPPAGDSSG